MQNLYSVYKPIGLTPLDMVRKLKEHYPLLAGEKIGYAGRLDPMAEGVLLLLVGEENKKRQKYLSLPKEYAFEILFGVATDTYDVLGLITDNNDFKTVERGQIEEIVKQYIRTFSQPYPPFSSKRINGTPLFKLARDGKISNIELPEKEVAIYSFELTTIRHCRAPEIKEEIQKKLSLVTGNFRQDSIMKKWEDYFSKTKRDIFQASSFTVSCSSGTYIRSLELISKPSVHRLKYTQAQ